MSIKRLLRQLLGGHEGRGDHRAVRPDHHDGSGRREHGDEHGHHGSASEHREPERHGHGEHHGHRSGHRRRHHDD